MYTVADPRPPREGHKSGRSEPTPRTGDVDLPERAPRAERPVRPEGPEAPDGVGTQSVACVVDSVDVASVARVSGLLFTLVAAAMVVAAAALWFGALSVGVVADLEGFMSDLGFEEFSFDALQLFRAALLASMAVVLLGAGLSVLLAVLYNAISPLVGGVQIVERTSVQAGPTASPEPKGDTTGVV
jgi:hypothetical protein